MSKRAPYAPTYTITAPKHKQRADGGASTASTVPSKTSKSTQASADAKQGTATVVLPTPVPTAKASAGSAGEADSKAAANVRILKTLEQVAIKTSAATRQHRLEIGAALSSHAGVPVANLPQKTAFGTLTVYGLAIRLYVLIDEQNKRDRATIAAAGAVIDVTLREIQRNAIGTRLSMMTVLNEVSVVVFNSLLAPLRVVDPDLERLLRQLSFLNTQIIDDVIDRHASIV